MAIVLMAAAMALGGLAAAPPAVSAAGVRVVVVVGPVESTTARYIRMGKEIASQARSYGATVSEIYSPNATWSRVVKASRGANILVYLGHGNGWPSPYAPFDASRKDGMGLNAVAGAGHSNVKYYGESLVAKSIRLAPNSVVILNHLCYASGNSEPGRADPTKSVAIRRVDNFGAGFLRTGAAAVIAEGRGMPGYVLNGLFNSDRTLRDIFWSSSDATERYAVTFTSKRTPGAKAIMDPYAPGRYYRSIIGKLDVTAADWR